MSTSCAKCTELEARLKPDGQVGDRVSELEQEVAVRKEANGLLRAQLAAVERQRDEARADYDCRKERLDAALDELRCPDCKCADQIDAESNECGCDSVVCARDGSKTLAQFTVEQHGHLHELLKAAAAYVNLCDQLMPQMRKPLPGIAHNYKGARAAAEKAFAFLGLHGRLDDWIRANIDAEHKGSEER